MNPVPASVDVTAILARYGLRVYREDATHITVSHLPTRLDPADRTELTDAVKAVTSKTLVFKSF